MESQTNPPWISTQKLGVSWITTQMWQNIHSQPWICDSFLKESFIPSGGYLLVISCGTNPSTKIHLSFNKSQRANAKTRGAWKQISANSSVTFSSASNTNLPNLRCTTGGGNFCTVVGRSSWWSRDASYICRNGRNVRKYEPLEAWKPSRLLK